VHAANTAATALAAPFIGLAFVIALPFIGLGALAWAAGRALMRNATARFARDVLLFVAAPFIGLAYALAFPFIGAGALAWYGARAVARRARKA
jgi:hypothetical protein